MALNRSFLFAPGNVARRVEAAGMRLGNIMMHGFPNVILGTAERDRDIENVQQSIRIAGRLGIPIVEYNFFGLRNVEGLDRRPGAERHIAALTTRV